VQQFDMKPLIKIGWREIVALPELNIECLHAKIDTGARSSAIHAESIRQVQEDGIDKVHFDTISNDTTQTIVHCCLPIVDKRYVMNSGGSRELRYFVRTKLCLGPGSWDIELSLTTRHKLRFSMLLGREAMKRNILISPGRRYLAGPPSLSPLLNK
jgi:hypothetical protein